jgi:glycogen synthase
VPRYLKAADIFCFASVTETQGLVTMEAMAAGLPIVAVDATGTSDEVEHGTHGLLTQNDSQALGQAIARLLDEPELRQKLATAALQKSNRLTASHQAEKLLEVYAQAIEDKQAEKFVSVDKKKKIFSFSFEEDQWDDLLERANKFGQNIQDIINPPKVDKK